jgi:hypothetical protein
VAIVSISRIQVRRGQAGAGSGIPQLAGGEFGWAVDTQALYIGNGSVAEGAPTVGNTKILTEHDNLFELSSTYIYGNENLVQTGATAGAPVERTLKARLDDLVSVRAFGVIGDGLSDETVKLQRAIDQLFTGDGLIPIFTRQRVTLYIPAGTYNISNSLKLPPFTTLIGDGSDKTIINQTGNFPVFETVNGLRTPGVAGPRSSTTTLNQARHIAVKGMTLNITGNNVAMYLDNCANSDFEDIKIDGDWFSSASYTDNYAIKLDLLSTAINSNNNFRSIKINGFQQAVHADMDIAENHFENCVFENCQYGIVFGESPSIGAPGVTVITTGASGTGTTATLTFTTQPSTPFTVGQTITVAGITPVGYNGTYVVTNATVSSVSYLNATTGAQTVSGTVNLLGQATGPLNNTVSKSQFKDINRQGIWVRRGRGNKSISNSFESVGNDGGSEINAVYSVIKFETIENASQNDFFDRSKKLSTESAYTLSAAYTPEIEGRVDNTNTYSLSINVGYTVSFTNSFRLPADTTKSYIVYYLYKSSYVNAVRHGTLEITVNRNNNTTSLTDTYDYVGDPAYNTSLDFNVTLNDLNADANVDTVLVQTRDSILNDQATILFQVKTQS